jgi:hypothetical protein
MQTEFLGSLSKSLNILRRVLANGPAEIDGELLDAWGMALEAAGLTAADIAAATPRLLQSQRFFPTPADFIEAVRPKANQDAEIELAWQKVRATVARVGSSASVAASDLGGDEHALWAADRVGWERLGQANDEERVYAAADFRKLYRAAREQNNRLAYLVGRFERENAAENYPAQAELTGRPEWAKPPAERPAGLPQRGEEGLVPVGAAGALLPADGARPAETWDEHPGPLARIPTPREDDGPRHFTTEDGREIKSVRDAVEIVREELARAKKRREANDKAA